MTDLQPLTVLLGQNERQRDAAIAAHRKAEATSEAAAAQAEQLVVYRREYEQRWTAQFQREGKMELVICYQSFMEKLTLAVDQQARIAEHATQQLQNALASLREAEMRCASVRKLIERRTIEHRQGEDRRDQKQTDEMASRAAWGRIGSNGPNRLM